MGPDGRVRDPHQLELFGTLLTELQGMRARAGGGGGGGGMHRVGTPTGVTYVGTWEEIVRQMKDEAVGWADGSVEGYMAASGLGGRKHTGTGIPAPHPAR